MILKRLGYVLLFIFVLLLLITSVLFVRSIDWKTKHAKKLSELPLLSSFDDEGMFRLQANNMEFLVRVAGMQNEGPAVILLHGFPQSSIM